jgi:hypothetical protein
VTIRSSQNAGNVEECEAIAHRRLRDPELLRQLHDAVGLVAGGAPLVDDALEGLRFLDRRQRLPLVAHDLPNEPIGRVLDLERDLRGDRLELGAERAAVPPLPVDEHPAPLDLGMRPHLDRLQHAVLRDRVGELRVDGEPRLRRIRIDDVDGEIENRRRGRAALHGVRMQCHEPPVPRHQSQRT